MLSNLLDELNIEKIDQTIMLIRKQMEDKPGNRLNTYKLQELQDKIDNLLDARIVLTNKQNVQVLPLDSNL